MDITLKCEGSYKFDAMSLGEVMLRLDPGEGRIKTANSFNVYEGGGEYNVTRALSKVFDLRSSVITALADNEVGLLIKDLIMRGGVDTSNILMREYDGIGKASRNGLNFVERGFGLRGALGVSDRANTAVSQLKPGELDFKRLFFDEGVSWFHTGGIFTFLSESCADTALEAVKTASDSGSVVSYDFNFRPSLYKACDNKDRLKEVSREIIKHCDIVFGNEFDLVNVLGFAPDNSDYSVFDKARYEKYMDKFLGEYPNVKAVFTSRRKVFNASKNGWGGVLFDENGCSEGMYFESLDILDRIGGGDGFASGIIYALMNGKTAKEALDYGICHGALAMTTPGDTSMTSIGEIEKLMNGGSSAVIR